MESDGQPVTDRSFRGKYLLIYFGYTSCRDVCPTTLTSIAAALDRLWVKRRAWCSRCSSLSIRHHDTPEVMRRYVSSFTPRLIGLTGTPAELRRVASQYRHQQRDLSSGSDAGSQFRNLPDWPATDEPSRPIQADEDAAKLAQYWLGTIRNRLSTPMGSRSGTRR